MATENIASSAAGATIMDESAPESPKPPPLDHSKRTRRACDRCRIKKAKCNGQRPCNTCVVKDRTCIFSALRRRDIQKWHCHMQDIADEAIQRLYGACLEHSNFPGVIPEEINGVVTTESILKAMGFNNFDLSPPHEDKKSQSYFQRRPEGLQPVLLSAVPTATGSGSRDASTSSKAVSEPLSIQPRVASASIVPKRIQSPASDSALVDMDEQFKDAVNKQAATRRLSYPQRPLEVNTWWGVPRSQTYEQCHLLSHGASQTSTFTSPHSSHSFSLSPTDTALKFYTPVALFMDRTDDTSFFDYDGFSSHQSYAANPLAHSTYDGGGSSDVNITQNAQIPVAGDLEMTYMPR